jgi:hypothetical protein
MFKVLLTIFLSSSLALAGLPPTTSKVSGDSTDIVTFKYRFPNFTGTHTGSTVALGVNSIAGGGTGQATKAAAFDALSPMTTSGDIIYGGASGTGTRLAKGSDGQVLTLASGLPSWAAASATSTKIATIKDVKSSGTPGQTVTAGSYVTQELNTLNDPQTIGVTLLSNQFTLPAGTYSFKAYGPSYRATEFKMKLRNITDSTDTILGTTGWCRASDVVGQCTSEIMDVFTIAGTKTFEIQKRVGASSQNQPAGFGDSEVYLQVYIEKR